MKVLPLAFLVVLAVATAVHGRAIRLRRSSSYYANETACIVDDVAYFNGDPVPSSDPCEECKCRTPGFVCTITECEEKEGCQRIKVPGECCSYKCGQSEEVTRDSKDAPVTTTVAPTSTISDVKEKDQEHVHDHKDHAHHDSEDNKEHGHGGSEDHTHHHKEELQKRHEAEEEKGESGAVDVDEPKSEVITTSKPSELAVDDQKGEQHEKPDEIQPKIEEKSQRPSKRSELPASVGLSQESTSVESTSKATEEPESSTKQESDNSDKKLEEVPEPKKEGRSGSDKPQLEVTSPASEEPSPSSPQEPETDSKDNVEHSDHKDIIHQPGHSDSSHSGHSSEQGGNPSIEKRHSLGEQSDLPSESPKDEKEPKQQPDPVPSEEKSSEEVIASDSPSTESPSEDSKHGQVQVVVVSSTPQADKQEAREAAEKKEEESDVKEKRHETSTELPLTDNQESQSTVAPSDSPVEETTEARKESTPAAKSSPSKRFADWIDYVPRGFQA